MSKISVKRFFVFFFLIVLGIIPLLTEEFVFRIIAIGLLVIYIGFIIFLRDGKKETSEKELFTESPAEEKEEIASDSQQEEKEILTSAELRNMARVSDVHTLKPTDLKEKFYEIAAEDLPHGMNQDAQFNFVLEKILNVIKYTLIANSTVFFWFNKKKQQLIIQSFVSDDPQIHKGRFNLEGDIISRVVSTSSPEILNNINSNVESDLIKYYDSPVGIKSIVAVPVFFNGHLIGVLVADSKSEDAFGVETVYLLGRFVRMITIMFGIFDEKFDSQIVSQKLDALTNLIGDTEKNTDEKVFIQKISNALEKLMEWDALSITLFDQVQKNYKLKKVVTKTSLRYPGEGLIIDFDSSLVGKALQTGLSVFVEDASASKFITYSADDEANFGGSILISPIIYQNKAYGAITIESLRKHFYSKSDTRFLEKIALYAASQFELIYNINLLNSYLSIDLESLLMNKTTFLKRVQEDLAKSNITKVNLGLALISIDNFEKFYSEYGARIVPKLIKHIVVHLNRESDEFMLLARLEQNKFGILFFNKDDADCFLWCEKIRQKVVRDFLNIDGKNINITVSI
ncbi:MAG: GAF domain-containing protein, partial [Ignavibacteria bacterium]|nr:GAF domain-containing protein [Ignavibacteria bacterium]